MPIQQKSLSMPETEAISNAEILRIDDELWEQLIELTDGAAALCYQCGVCTASCPWGLVRQRPLTVRTLMHQAQLGLKDENGSLWLCTTCAQCEVYCPRGVNIADVFRSLRTVAWENRYPEAGLPALLWSIFWNNNPWSQPPNQRAQWAANLNIPIFNPEEHELLLYIGCTSSYDQRAQKIASALVHLLRAGGVEFGYLGEEEPCCGESVLSVGHKHYFAEVAARTAQVFRERGVTNLVTISPHCYDVFRNHYDINSGDFQPLHYTQYLASLVTEGRLNFERSLDARITFQDPCYLGRVNSEYEAPRLILDSIPGVELVEMESSAQDGLCCGGGGGRMWLETPLGERFSDLRVDQAVQTGAAMLGTACPFCVACLEDSLKGKNIEQIEVCDIAEIAARAI
jgi:Fe-S oxidoreductase